MNHYVEKYQKCKAEYISLKTKYYNTPIIIINQIGGKVFQKTQKLYIVATPSQRKFKSITKDVTDTILGENVKPYRTPHITLFNLIINAENPDSDIFQNEKFYNKIADFYADIIANKNDPLILEASTFPHDYSFPGFKPRYFLKNYKPMNVQKIWDFRDTIFDLLESMLGKSTVRKYIDNNGTSYHMYSFNGEHLFAESSYYDTWKPHLDFLNDFDIEKHNPTLQKQLDKHYVRADKIEVLVNKIKHVSPEIYNTIDMSKHMRNITYAIDHIMIKKFKV